jgi:hypothetical protein
MEASMRASTMLTNGSRALALCLFTALASPASAMDRRTFTFADAEYPSASNGVQSAQAFIHNALPVGLSMDEAASRVEHADAQCSASPAGGAVNCSFSATSRPHDGYIGEDVWTVQLTPGANGDLQQATLTRSRY